MAELDKIIAERLERLQQLRVTGADLVIATVGAGLRALTRYERVEQDNGETLPAERFLALVQGRVLDAIFGSLASADPVTRYYIAAQYSYGYAAVPFDEANNLARMTGVDLDSQHGLTGGRNPLVLKQGSTVALRDFEDRGGDPQLGLPVEGNGQPALLDVAHGLLWRAEHRPSELPCLLAGRPAGQRASASGHSGTGGQGTALCKRRREVTGGRRGRTPAGLLAAIRRRHLVRAMREIAADSDAAGDRSRELLPARGPKRNRIDRKSPEHSHE